jgi:DNA-directed RNA polymerase subunit N
MIIPIKCFTCGKVLGDKYLFYVKKVRGEKLKKDMDPEAVLYLEEKTIKKTIEGEVLDNLGLNKMCCRRHMLSHVDIE